MQEKKKRDAGNQGKFGLEAEFPVSNQHMEKAQDGSQKAASNNQLNGSKEPAPKHHERQDNHIPAADIEKVSGEHQRKAQYYGLAKRPYKLFWSSCHGKVYDFRDIYGKGKA